jgi:hypothetical protein
MQRQRVVTRIKRTLRLSGRKRITRDLVSLELILNDEGEAEAFKGWLNLNSLELPQDAYVVVEAMHGEDGERFEIGKVGNGSITITRRELEWLKSYGTSLYFRVLVVEPRTRRILASAERLRPFTLREEPLLSHKKGDIGKLAWDIEFSEEGPLLILNKNLPQGAFRSCEFVCFALPAILREILDRAVREKSDEGWEEELESREDESEDWKSQWLRFARELTGLKLPKGSLEDASFRRNYESWVNDVVKTFCMKKTSKEWDSLLRRYQK